MAILHSSYNVQNKIFSSNIRVSLLRCDARRLYHVIQLVKRENLFLSTFKPELTEIGNLPSLALMLAPLGAGAR